MEIHEETGLAYSFDFADLIISMGESTTPVYVLHPDLDVLASAIPSLYHQASAIADEDTPIRIVGEDFEDLFDSFRVGRQAVALAEMDVAEFRLTDDLPVETMFTLSEAAVNVLLRVGNQRVLMKAEEGTQEHEIPIVQAKRTWGEASTHSVSDQERWDEVMESLMDHTSEAMMEEFTQLLAIQRSRDTSERLRWTWLLLLAAARTHTPQSAVSEWGEQTASISGSTISRYKTYLDTANIIGSHRAGKSEPGRPYNVLHIEEEALQDLDIDTFYEYARQAIRQIETNPF